MQKILSLLVQYLPRMLMQVQCVNHVEICDHFIKTYWTKHFLWEILLVMKYADGVIFKAKFLKRLL